MKISPERICQILLAALASFMLSGCGGPTVAEVVKPFRPKYEALAKQLAEMATQDPKSAVRPQAPLSPKPVYTSSGAGANTEIVMFDQLTDTRYDPNSKKMDLNLSRNVLTQIRTALLPESQQTGTAPKMLEKQLTDALTVRYIGAVKILTSQAPVIANGGFSSGKVTGVVMLFDRESTKLIFADGFTATNDSEVKYTEHKDEKANLQGWLTINLDKNVKKAVLAKFAEGTGGTFEPTVN